MPWDSPGVVVDVKRHHHVNQVFLNKYVRCRSQQFSVIVTTDLKKAARKKSGGDGGGKTKVAKSSLSTTAKMVALNENVFRTTPIHIYVPRSI